MSDRSDDEARRLSTSRVVDAPRERVFRAFSDPTHLAKWWGPKGFTNTFYQLDPRPGGAWTFTMHGPDGVDYKNVSEFVEVVPPERIVLRHVSRPRFEMTITLDDAAGRTRVGWCQLFDTAAECARVKPFAVEANEQNLDRLEAVVAQMG
jgi:uncharacterized protein YndB with AHSA1/START domain